ncbi:unnamed protein product [Prunus armeniaca]
MAELFKKDAEAPLCFQSMSALASHSCVSKNLSRSFPSSEVRNSPVKWANWIDRLLPRYGAHSVLLKYRHLVEALHNHTDVGLGPTILAYLFKNLRMATLENPLNLSAPGAFWMIQIWLQVYFPELRFPDIVLPEDQVLALPLMSAEVPKRSIEEYLMFFRDSTKRLAAQWQVVIRRTHPWFQLGYQLFEN